jgi:hypothetical protein
MTIHFGTDGWRAVISDTFTFTNLRLVAQAIADAAASPDWSRLPAHPGSPAAKKMVVGFDTRFLSDRFAAEVARVLAANGYSVHLAQADAPTPAISYAVQHMKAMGGVMITASHNAPRYNGVKLKSSYGGSALPEQCRRVEIYLTDNEARGRGPNLMDYGQALKTKNIRRFNPIPAYHEHLRTLIDFDAIATNPPRVVVDSMYGSGRGQIKTILQGTGCEVFEVRGEMNPGFGGVHPEPGSAGGGDRRGTRRTGSGHRRRRRPIRRDGRTRTVRRPAPDHGTGTALPGGKTRLARQGGQDRIHNTDDQPACRQIRFRGFRNSGGIQLHRRLHAQGRCPDRRRGIRRNEFPREHPRG